MNTYLMIKSLHVISVISWMAGMLYLPRLFAYHAEVPPGSERDKMLQRMERRLLRIIINPAMFATLLSGVGLITQLGAAGLGGWFHAKIMLVMVLFATHGMCAHWRRQFEQGNNTKSALFYRWMNEAPAVLMIGIVILVICKPF
jgi:putative membrane protein